jgi:hypothetical protein
MRGRKLAMGMVAVMVIVALSGIVLIQRISNLVRMTVHLILLSERVTEAEKRALQSYSGCILLQTPFALGPLPALPAECRRTRETGTSAA